MKKTNFVSKLLSQRLNLPAWREKFNWPQTEKTLFNKKTLENCKDKLCARCNHNPRFHGKYGDKYTAYCVDCHNNKPAE
jgi:hypothetical protein